MAAGAAVVKSDEKKSVSGSQKLIGLLGGVAWASSSLYYSFLNQEVNRRLGGAHSARVILNSLDLEPYVEALKAKDYAKVRGLITTGCAQLQNAGADLIVLCTNTGHIAYDQISRTLATTPVLHMADCTAKAVKQLGFTKCGFIGTKFAMENADIQLNRLRLHGLEVVIPSAAATREKLWHIIETELSVNVFSAASKAVFKGIIEAMKAEQGVECVILGCTEIPLLINSADTTVPLIDTSRVHASVALDVSLGAVDMETLIPPSLVVPKVEKKKKVVPAATGVAPATAPAPTAAAAAAPKA